MKQFKIRISWAVRTVKPTLSVWLWATQPVSVICLGGAKPVVILGTRLEGVFLELPSPSLSGPRKLNLAQPLAHLCILLVVQLERSWKLREKSTLL